MTSYARLANEAIPVVVLIAIITVVVRRFSTAAMDHSPKFRRRRRWNWLLLGFTYAFLYMGRYNLVTLKDVGLLTREEFGRIDAAGGLTYGLSFLVNGPIADRLGGRFTLLVAVFGATIANFMIGIVVSSGSLDASVIGIFFAANMYFQSFGAVSTVKVNGAWFHVRERGVFGGVFGVMIAIGLYLAFDWVPLIGRAVSIRWIFFAPALVLAVSFAVCWVWLCGHPDAEVFPDFDTGDAPATTRATSTLALLSQTIRHPVILTIGAIGMCSGFLRQGILTWYRDFASGVGSGGSFVYAHWGVVVCIAGITGGLCAGFLSDRLFQSRRGPVAVILYGTVVVTTGAIVWLMSSGYEVDLIVALLIAAVIGVHGILAGVATQDFGGRSSTGTVAGLTDGFVYLGTAIQALLLGSLLPAKGTAAAGSYTSWYAWPVAMMPVGAIGLGLALLLWNARPGRSQRC